MPSVQEINQYPLGAPHKPWLSQEAAELYGVRYSVNEETGALDAVYYPYKKRGEVVKYKPRYLPKTFSSVGANTPSLFGEDLVGSSGRFLVLHEGEDDALAGYTMLLACGKKYRVVSLQDGANEERDDGVVPLSAPLLKRLPLLAKFEKVVLAFDNDSAGKGYANALAEKLAPLTSVYILDFPQGVKDADEMCKAGKAWEYMQCINNAREYIPEGVIQGKDVPLSLLQETSVQGLSLPYPELQRMLHGLRPGEITLLCAGSGIGKTTMCRELGSNLVSFHNQTVGNIFLEEQHGKTAQGYIAIDNNIPLAMLRANPSALTTPQWQASYDKYIQSNKTHYFKHFGSIASDRLTTKMLYMIHGLGCQWLVLDHISLVISGQESQNERKDIDLLMTRLAELVNSTGVGILAVVHLKRSTSGVGKSFNKGDEVELTDLRGSAALEQLSWNVIALERDQQNATQCDISKIRLLKNREWGFTGLCDTLEYNHTTGRLLTFDPKLG